MKSINQVDISIIVVNWNTRDILKDCLRSVYEQTQDISFELIVVDNASSDSSVSMVKSEFPQVILIVNKENRGFAAANNQGMQIANGRYVLLLNSDTIVLDGAIQKTLVFGDKHPEAAVVGCRVLNPDKSLQPTCFMYPSLLNLFLSSTYLYKSFPRSRFFGRERMTWWFRDDVREVEVVTGCFMLVRKEAIETVGMMDESFFMYAEETDWCYRFKKVGWKLLFTPEAQIVHIGGQSSKKIKGEMLIQLRMSILYFIKKNYTNIYFVGAATLTVIFLMIRIPVWFIKGIFLRNSKQEAFIRVAAYYDGIRKTMKLICSNKA
ncbi:MAG TPA: glycosyltransferase family 2 protein [Anaerohalosphaeraceae bacterium]|nr:glycosyltransferase family 2 protein [Anaerohalosphaeraceae bacterium]